jgi:hypothetical protein
MRAINPATRRNPGDLETGSRCRLGVRAPSVIGHVTVRCLAAVWPRHLSDKRLPPTQICPKSEHTLVADRPTYRFAG